MPRLNFIEETDFDAEARALIASAERTGAPDPRVVRLSPREKAALEYAVGVGRLVRSLDILSWQEACELAPSLLEKA